LGIGKLEGQLGGFYVKGQDHGFGSVQDVRSAGDGGQFHTTSAPNVIPLTAENTQIDGDPYMVGHIVLPDVHNAVHVILLPLGHCGILGTGGGLGQRGGQHLHVVGVGFLALLISTHS